MQTKLVLEYWHILTKNKIQDKNFKEKKNRIFFYVQAWNFWLVKFFIIQEKHTAVCEWACCYLLKQYILIQTWIGSIYYSSASFPSSIIAFIRKCFWQNVFKNGLRFSTSSMWKVWKIWIFTHFSFNIKFCFSRIMHKKLFFSRKVYGFQFLNSFKAPIKISKSWTLWCLKQLRMSCVVFVPIPYHKKATLWL